jgi:hypothetical protein
VARRPVSGELAAGPEMRADDLTAHYRDVVSELCRAASLGGLTVEIVRRDDSTVIGPAASAPGDPPNVVRVGATVVMVTEVGRVSLWAPPPAPSPPPGALDGRSARSA